MNLCPYRYHCADIRNNVLMSNSSFSNIQDLALVIKEVWGDVTVAGMDMSQVSNKGITVYGKQYAFPVIILSMTEALLSFFSISSLINLIILPPRNIADTKGTVSLLDSVVTDIDAGPSRMAIQFDTDNFIVVNNLTLIDTHRSNGISVYTVDSFTMTNSVLGRSETGIVIGSKYFL